MSRNRWAAAAVVCLGVFMLAMDLTVLNVAIPDLQRALAPSMAEIQWIVDSYALVVGGTVLATGAITDHIGRRRAFVTGLIFCAVTASFGAVSEHPWQLIAARGAMGAGAALLMPATLSILTTLFPEPSLRRRAIALWTGAVGVGGLTGPVIGGWLVDLHSWRAGFWVTVPIAAVAVVSALLVVPESRAPREHRADLPGAALSAAGLLTLVWAIIESPSQGWTHPAVLAAFIVAVALLTAFTFRQARAGAPMLPLPLLRRPRIGATTLALLLASFALYGTLFIITLYLQGVLGYSPWQAGVRMLPMAAALVAGAAIALPLQARYGDKIPIVAGLGVFTASFVLLATTGTDSGYPHLLVCQLIGGVGGGMIFTAGTEAVMGAVPAHRAGLGSAINDATRQVGATLGVAVQGSVLTAVSTDHLREHLPTTPGSVLDTWSQATGLPEAARTTVLAAARASFLEGMNAAALTAAAVTIAAALLAHRFLPRHSTYA